VAYLIINAYKILFKKPEGMRPFGRRRRRREDNIKLDLKRNKVWGYGLGLNGWGQGPVTDPYEHDNEISGHITGRKCLKEHSDSQLFKTDSAAW